MRASTLTRRTRLALIAGLTTLFVLVGATTSYALWTVTATIGSTSTGATVGVTHALSNSTLAVTYNSTTTAASGVVTITNTSTRAGTYALAISSTSASATLRAAVDVSVGSTAACTPTATLTGAVAGTFAATVTKTGAIAAGASVVLCVKTSMTGANITANASTSLAATLSSSVAVGTWSATAAPTISFTQSVAAPTGTLSNTAWYRLSPASAPTKCIEGQYSQTANGTQVVQDTCEPTIGTASNELFRFTPTTGGYYRIVNKNAPSLGIGASQNGNNRGMFLLTATDNRVQWLPIFNADSTVTFQSRDNTGRCLSVPGGATGNNVQLQVQNCDGGSSQKFTLTMYNVGTPAPVTLSCTADGYNAYYSWPQLTGYENEVVYRVSIGGILVNPHARGTGYDPTVQFGNGSITTAIYGSGSKQVLVEQNVSNIGWTTTGTGTLVLASSAPFLLCG